MRSNLEKINQKATIRSLPWKEKWGILLAEQEAAAGSAKGDKIVIYTVCPSAYHLSLTLDTCPSDIRAGYPADLPSMQ